MKLHLLGMARKGRLPHPESLALTPASVNDFALFRELWANMADRVFFGDRIYFDRPFFAAMMETCGSEMLMPVRRVKGTTERKKKFFKAADDMHSATVSSVRQPIESLRCVAPAIDFDIRTLPTFLSYFAACPPAAGTKPDIMEETALKAELKQHIIKYLNLLDIKLEDIKDDEPLFGEALGLDSIDALELSVLMEREYGIKITDPAEGRKILYDVNSMAAHILANKPTA